LQQLVAAASVDLGSLQRREHTGLGQSIDPHGFEVGQVVAQSPGSRRNRQNLSARGQLQPLE
jgi:hypothetical protein